MNRTEKNAIANKILIDRYRKSGIDYCESCGSREWLTFAHRQKRRHYSSIVELVEPSEVILLCLKEHEKIEKDPELTRQLFEKLRNIHS